MNPNGSVDKSPSRISKEVETVVMRCLEIVRLPILALLVLAALLYLATSVISLFTAVAVSNAGTAPTGTFHAVQIGDIHENNNPDYVYNWDFNSRNRTSDNVDWGMRFLFAGQYVTVDYVKDRLDDAGNDPSITPDISSSGWDQDAFLGDGPQQTGSNWTSDDGIKNWPGCMPNWGHMRVYARGQDHNFHPALGNYVVASTHVDTESDGWDVFSCRKQYRSYESDESDWRTRISNHLLGLPYKWSIGASFNWRNASGPNTEYVYLSRNPNNHHYQSDGHGTVINVRHNYPPQFQSAHYNFQVNESQGAGTVVGTVSATDPNTGDTLSYTIVTGNSEGKFTIAAGTGEITVAGPLDPAVIWRMEYTLVVRVSDQYNASDDVVVTIRVI